MIRINLATRPFYNTRFVTLAVAAATGIALAMTALNVVAVIHYSGANTELVTKAGQDEAAAADLRAMAQRLRATVDIRQVEQSAVHVREANALIDRRTLSWTELLNALEATLPAGVRITAVQPHITRTHDILLDITVQAHTVKDIDDFMGQLDTLGTFNDVRSTQEQMTDSQQIESTLQMRYEPRALSTPPVIAPTVTR